MTKIPSVTSKRFISAIPKFKKILELARGRDVNESDTVTIVTDILEEVFGFDKYSEITREYAIQGTYCDLAIKSTKRIEYLIEVKAIGVELKDPHLRQAINYAAQEGIKWVVLTNGIHWQLHRVIVDEKVKNSKLFNFDFLSLNPRNIDDQEKLFVLCKRGVQKDLIDDLYEFKQTVNRYSVGSVLLTDPVLNVVRKELRNIKDGLKVETEEIKQLLINEVLKRDLLDSEAGKEAQKQFQKAFKKKERAKLKIKSTINIIDSNVENDGIE